MKNNGFKPGQSGNPGGRPKLPEDVKHVRELAREYTTEAVEALVSVIRGESSPGAKVSAAQALLDRGWGKAEATLNVNSRKMDPNELSDDELAAIAAGGRAASAEAPSSEGEPKSVH